MDEQIDPNGFLVVLPGEIIAIPRDSDKSWLMLFYSLTQELENKRKLNIYNRALKSAVIF